MAKFPDSAVEPALPPLARMDGPEKPLPQMAPALLVPPTPTALPEQARFGAKLSVVLFIVAYLLSALAALFDLWIFEAEHVNRLLGLPADYVLPPGFVTALHVMLGAILGAGVLDIVNFHEWNSMRGDFQARHVWGYFLAPLLASVLGLVVFALLQTGLLVFAGGSDKADEAARLGYLGVGFLSGFGWSEATQSIRRIVGRFFSNEAAPPTEDDSKESVAAPAAAPSASSAADK